MSHPDLDLQDEQIQAATDDLIVAMSGRPNAQRDLLVLIALAAAVVHNLTSSEEATNGRP